MRLILTILMLVLTVCLGLLEQIAALVELSANCIKKIISATIEWLLGGTY